MFDISEIWEYDGNRLPKMGLINKTRPMITPYELDRYHFRLLQNRAFMNREFLLSSNPFM